MGISPVADSMWSDILRLQEEAYFAFEPESLDTLKSKWTLSPDTCFVYMLENRPVAYLLAHGWSGEELPKLHRANSGGTRSEYLFLHDLVVSKRCNGLGIGVAMVNHLVSLAVQLGFRQVKLVAVQGSSPFWSKRGFRTDARQAVSAGYGENAVAMYLGLDDPAEG